MIQIGTKVWIVDGLRSSYKGSTHTTETMVYYEGTPVGTIKEIKMEWQADKAMATKWCSLTSHTGDGTIEEAFAQEMATHGFAVEILYPSKDIVELYHLSDGKIVREEHRWKGSLDSKKSKIEEA